MSNYRICPYKLTEWKVQYRLNYNHAVWLDVKELLPYSDNEVIKSFATEQEAEKYIDMQKLAEVLQIKIKQREKNIPPREYP